MTSTDRAGASRLSGRVRGRRVPRPVHLPGPSRLGRAGQLILRLAVLLLAMTAAPEARAFGEEGAFNPRILLTGTSSWTGQRRPAPARWAMELVRRTSAPARLAPTTVRADEPALLAEPFVIWAGATEPEPLTRSEILGLRRFLALGGVIFVDDFRPERGAFLRGAKRELARVWPDAKPISIGPEHVVFRSFYLLRRPVGRVAGPAKLDAIVRRGAVQVILSAHDLLGALARRPGDVHTLEVTPGGELQREKAIRLAVNIAMYVLCSNYKDDQVHAPVLMRRRAAVQP